MPPRAFFLPLLQIIREKCCKSDSGSPTCLMLVIFVWMMRDRLIMYRIEFTKDVIFSGGKNGRRLCGAKNLGNVLVNIV